MPCGSHKYKPPNKGINETPDPPETGRTVLDDNDNKIFLWRPMSYLSQHVANIEKEHTAMKSELKMLEDRLRSKTDLLLLKEANTKEALQQLQKQVARLEKVPTQQTLPSSHSIPPYSIPIPPPPPPQNYKSPQTNKASQDTAQQAPPSTKPPKSRGQGSAPQLGNDPKLLEKLRRQRAAVEGNGPQDFDTNIKGIGVVGKKQGKKFQIFGKQNRYTV